MKARSDAYAKFTPDIEARSTVVKPIVASAAPADISPILRLIASRKETFFTRPVACLTKTLTPPLFFIYTHHTPEPQALPIKSV